MQSSIDEEDEKVEIGDQELDEDGAPAVINRRMIRT